MSSGCSVLVRGFLLAAAVACSSIFAGCVADAVDAGEPGEQVGATREAEGIAKDPTPPPGRYGSSSSTGSSGAGGGSEGTITDPADAPPASAGDVGDDGTGDGSGPQPDPWIPQATIDSPVPSSSK
jgi:hypothetical protein